MNKLLHHHFKFNNGSSLKRDAIIILTVGIFYFFAHQLSYFFPDTQKVLMSIWPAGGIGLAALLLNPRRLWPYIALTLFIAGNVANFIEGRQYFASLGFMIANIVESLGCAWFITAICKKNVRFNCIREILALIGATLLVNTISSFIGAGTATYTSGANFWNFWETWYIADGLGILLITPLVVSWANYRKILAYLKFRKLAEYLIFLTIWSSLAWFSFNIIETVTPNPIRPYLLFALLVWMALRFDMRGATIAFTVLAGIILTSAEINIGPSSLGGDNFTQRLLIAQAFIGIIATTGFMLTASYLETKKSVQSSIEDQARLKAISDNLPNGMVYQVLRESDGSQRFVYVSAGAEKINGVKAEEILKDSQKLYGLLHKDDLAAMAAANKESAINMTVFTIKLRFFRPDGQMRWMLLSSCPRRLSDGRMLWDGIQIDITDSVQADQALKENEEKLRNLFENMNDLVCEIDKDGKYTFLNNKFKETLGYEPSELLGTYAHSYIHPEDLEASAKKYEQVKQVDKQSTDIWRFRHKNGEYKVFECKANVYDNAQNELRTVVIARDITVQKNNESELIAAKEKAEESDRLKTAFLHNMSHEIRTPLNSIMGFSDLLQKNFDNKPKLEKFSQIIYQRSSDLLGIIEDILDIAKIESGQLPMHLEECTLSEFFSEIKMFVEGYRIRLNKQHIDCKIGLSCLPHNSFVIIDKTKLKQVFVNLISNAFKFTDTGTIKIGCKLIEDSQLEFYVSDTGVGIPADKFVFIFQRFAQIDMGSTRKYSGTGLGLPIVKGIVKLMGGKIWLKSDLGIGSTFLFSIPYKHSEKIMPDQIETTHVGQYHFPDAKILIVEDEYYNLEYIKEILIGTNAYYTAVENGKDAIDKVLKLEFDLILLDIRLPDIDGYEIARKIKKHKPSIKIIAQTAFAGQLDKTKAKLAGCDDFISKPLKPEQLLSKINEQLSKIKKT